MIIITLGALHLEYRVDNKTITHTHTHTHTHTFLSVVLYISCSIEPQQRGVRLRVQLHILYFNDHTSEIEQLAVPVVYVREGQGARNYVRL